MFRLIKLRPPNGWNAVGWEMIVVILGVLIALAAQEWAEKWSWRGEAAETTRRLKAELGSHYTWSVEWRMVKPCIVAQIDRLQQRVLSSGSSLRPAPIYSEHGLADYVIRLPSKTYNTGAWTAALNSGVVAHLDPDTHRAMSVHYATLRSVVERTGLNDADYQRLFSLSRPIPLDAAVRFELLQRLDELRGRAELMDVESVELIHNVVELQATPSPDEVQRTISSFGTYRFCRAQQLPMRSFREASSPAG